MLSLNEEEIIEHSMNTVLLDPQSITQTAFMNAYNTVYAHCSAATDSYIIQGEAIYELIKKKIFDYTAGLVFKASIDDIAAQVAHFRRSAAMLSRVFSYIGRFYVRASAHREPPIDSLVDMYYAHVYFNYIFKIEESLIGLILLEIETARENLSQECGSLRTVVRFYLEILQSTGREERLRSFYKAYTDDFIQNTNFQAETGRLVKRIYLDMVYATNIFGDKKLCNEIVGYVRHRADDILSYTLARVQEFSNFRFIFRIIHAMDGAVMDRFKCEYGEFVKDALGKAVAFESHFGLYQRLKRQISENKMSLFGEYLDRLTQADFMDRTSSSQRAILDGLMGEFDRQISKENENGVAMEYYGGFKRKSKEGETEMKLAHSQKMENIKDILASLPEHEAIKLRRRGSGATKPRAPGAGEPAKMAPVKIEYQCTDLDLIISYFMLIANDSFLEAFVAAAQERLLRGLSPDIEAYIYKKIVPSVGNGSLSRLKSSIATYTEGAQHDIDGTKGSIRRHVKGFWNMSDDIIALPGPLEMLKNRLLEAECLTMKERIEINYSLSPITFNMAGTNYTMNTDVFSILLHLRLLGGRCELECLRAASGDRNFNSNLGFLMSNGFCHIERVTWDGEIILDIYTAIPDNCSGKAEHCGGYNTGTPDDHSSNNCNDGTSDNNNAITKHCGGSTNTIQTKLVVVMKNKQCSKGNVNLFKVCAGTLRNSETAIQNVKAAAVVEVSICRIMKKKKAMSMQLVVNETKALLMDSYKLEVTQEEIEAGIDRLISQGYLNKEESQIIYVP